MIKMSFLLKEPQQPNKQRKLFWCLFGPGSSGSLWNLNFVLRTASPWPTCRGTAAPPSGVRPGPSTTRAPPRSSLPWATSRTIPLATARPWNATSWARQVRGRPGTSRLAAAKGPHLVSSSSGSQFLFTPTGLLWEPFEIFTLTEAQLFDVFSTLAT